MLQRRSILRALGVVLSLSFCCGVQAADTGATTTKAAEAKVIELQLGSQGLISGQVVNRQGVAVANAEVLVANKQGKIGTVKTDQRGMFAAKGLKSGQVVMTVANQTYPVRLWSTAAAPPKSVRQAMLVVGDTVRGQCGSNCGGCSICSAVQDPCGSSILPGNSCGPNCGGCNSCGGGGCFGGSGFGGGLMSKPWLIGAGVAAAIAIPLAIDDDDAS